MSALEDDRSQTAEQVEAQFVALMGNDLGRLFFALRGELVWLSTARDEFLTLFDRGPKRYKLLTKAAPDFFDLVFDMMVNQTLIQIARVTDPARSLVKGQGPSENVSIRGLPTLVDTSIRTAVQDRVDEIMKDAENLRDIRNRRIAHRDLLTAFGQHPKPLIPTDREQINAIIEKLQHLFNQIYKFYFNSNMIFTFHWSGGAEALVTVLEEGMRSFRAQDSGIRRLVGISDDETGDA